MRLLLLLTILLHGGPLQANCFVDFNELVKKRLHQELKLSQGSAVDQANQTIIFNRLNFSQEEQQLVAETIDSVNAPIRSSKTLHIPEEISTSCGIEVRNGCLYFHHLYFDVDSLSFSSNLSLAEKRALVAHEYGHALLNRNLAESFPELVDYWRFGNDYQLYKQADDLLKANEARLNQLDLLEKFPILSIYNALGELYADAVAVITLKDPNIISQLIGKTYLAKFPQLKSIDELPLAATEKLQYRQFKILQNLLPEVSPDIHQTFYQVRKGLISSLEQAFHSPQKSEEVLVDLFTATQKTLDHFLYQDAQAARSFKELNELMERGHTLDASQRIHFQRLVEKLNQVMLQNLNRNK